MKYILLTIIVCLTINAKKPKNKEIENCIHGIDKKNKECTKCKEGFVLDNGICKSENLALTNHICEWKDGVCKSCNKGFALVGDKCVVCDTENCQNENHHLLPLESNETKCSACIKNSETNCSHCVCEGHECACKSHDCACEGHECACKANECDCEGPECSCKGPECSSEGHDCACKGHECAFKKCNKGFTFLNGKCEVCKTENCQNHDHHLLVKKSNHVNANLSSPSIKIQNCINYSEDQKSCVSCQSGYELNTDNICVKSKSNAFLISSIFVGSLLVAVIIGLVYYVFTLKKKLSDKNPLI